MISSESILINSTFNNVFVLSYYDGIKEVVDIENSTLYLWYDYAPNVDGEYWLKIKSNTEKHIIDYLENIIGIKDLIDNSKINLCTRLYEKYFKLNIADMAELNEDIILPENVRLGYNFMKKLKKLNINTLTHTNLNATLFETYNSQFSPSIENGINKFVIKNNKVVQDDYYFPIAA